MAQYKNMYNVELWKGPAAVSLNSMFLGDKNANRLGANVFDDGEAVALGGSCTGKAIRSDGSTVALSGTISGNQAYIDLPAACYAIPGPIQIYVIWGNSSTITTLVAGFGHVQVTETGTVIDPGTVVPDLSELLTMLEAMEQATEAAEAAAASIQVATLTETKNYLGIA